MTTNVFVNVTKKEDEMFDRCYSFYYLRFLNQTGRENICFFFLNVHYDVGVDNPPAKTESVVMCGMQPLSLTLSV